MLEVELSAADLATTNLAYSPLFELVSSLRLLDMPDAESMYAPWLAEVRPRVDALAELPLLRALVPPGTYIPDFLTPPPVAPHPELEDELTSLRATRPEVMVRDLRRAHPAGLPPELRTLVQDGVAGIERVVAALRTYWAAALAPAWPRLRDVLDADILYRGRDLSQGGASRFFGELHPGIRWTGSTLLVEREWSKRVAPGGAGVLLIPAIFTWPCVLTIADPPLRTTIVYPARGVATLWSTPYRIASPENLGRLMGGQRAALLAALDAPASTSELSRRMDLTASGVSQHLAVLRDAGLVRSSRSGRLVLYARTALGDHLTSAGRMTAPTTERGAR